LDACWTRNARGEILNNTESEQGRRQIQSRDSEETQRYTACRRQIRNNPARPGSLTSQPGSSSSDRSSSVNETGENIRQEVVTEIDEDSQGSETADDE